MNHSRLAQSALCAVLVLCLVRGAVAAAQPSSELGADRRAVSEALARHRKEPSVREVIAAMHARAGGGSAEALADRARLSGWVPTVGLKARRGQAVDLASSSEEDALKLSTDDDLTLEAALTFDLARVVFAREEVAIARQQQAEREHESERVREVIALYFERRRLQVERDLFLAKAAREAPGPNDETVEANRPAGGAKLADEVLARTVRIAEIEALLDAFTGGAFHRMMARPKAAAPP